MSDKNKLVTFETVNDLMLLKWGDGLESYINLKILREKCPCADCEGEKDVFGNIYKGRTNLINENSFLLTLIIINFKRCVLKTGFELPVLLSSVSGFWTDRNSDSAG